MNFIKKKNINNNYKLIQKRNAIIKKYYEDMMNKKRVNIQKYNSYMSLNNDFPYRNISNPIIPNHLYTCWHTKNLPPLMQENVNNLIQDNAALQFHLYDEDECREFIKNNFESDVLNTYNKLIPCSFKSDLWRYCMLYKNGGIYLDIKYKCKNNFKLEYLLDKEYFVRDMKTSNVYTALIVSLPNNNILWHCIRKIVENTQNNYYGDDLLDVTGPGLLGSFFNQDTKNSLEMFHQSTEISDNFKKFYIIKENRIILEFYDNYREEQSKYQKNKHYGDLWREKNIYI